MRVLQRLDRDFLPEPALGVAGGTGSSGSLTSGSRPASCTGSRNGASSRQMSSRNTSSVVARQYGARLSASTVKTVVAVWEVMPS